MGEEFLLLRELASRKNRGDRLALYKIQTKNTSTKKQLKLTGQARPFTTRHAEKIKQNQKQDILASTIKKAKS